MFEHSSEVSSVDCTYSENDERTNTGSGLYQMISFEFLLNYNDFLNYIVYLQSQWNGTSQRE